MLDKAYVRFRENIPDNANTYAAAEGFHIQGIPVVPFYGFGDLTLQNMPDLGPSTIVCGNIGDVWETLTLLGKPIPPPLDYPEHLMWLMGRQFDYVTLEQVRGLITRKFVKPVKQKLFGGFVFDPLDPRSRLAVAPYPDDTPCIISDEVNFVSEYRCFIKHDQPIGVKHYRGDSFISLDKSVYNKAIKCCKGKMPAAYSIDLGVVENEDGTHQTLLVEANEGYALGSYGLAGLPYARFLEARWEELTR
jgi:hypothetical protein